MEASLEQKIFALLKKRNETVTFAESLTGGLVSARFVDVAGVSAVYKEGYISYSDDAKKKFFHVSEEVLHVHTAVSEPCARQMAIGARDAAGCDWALSVTGEAGPVPSGDLPVGLVYAGICHGDFSAVEKFTFQGDRRQIREAACEGALLLLYNSILQAEEGS